MEYLAAFAAGFVSTLVFHQGAAAALHGLGLWPKAPFDMTATAPLRVPAVISLAFWGGLWGVALWPLLRVLPDPRYWICATLLGAIGPTLVALFVVMPLKEQPVAAGWNPKIIAGALVLNGAWGAGLALLLRLLRPGA